MGLVLGTVHPKAAPTVPSLLSPFDPFELLDFKKLNLLTGLAVKSLASKAIMTVKLHPSLVVPNEKNLPIPRRQIEDNQEELSQSQKIAE